MEDQLALKDREIRKLQQHKQALLEAHQEEITTLKLGHQEQLAVVEEKIKEALAKKNADIQQMKEQVMLKDVQLHKLKEILDQKRKELLLA